MTKKTRKNEGRIPEGIIIKTEDPNLIIVRGMSYYHIVNVSMTNSVNCLPGHKYSNSKGDELFFLGVHVPEKQSDQACDHFIKNMVFYCKRKGGRDSIEFLDPFSIEREKLFLVE